MRNRTGPNRTGPSPVLHEGTSKVLPEKLHQQTQQNEEPPTWSSTADLHPAEPSHSDATGPNQLNELSAAGGGRGQENNQSLWSSVNDRMRFLKTIIYLIELNVWKILQNKNTVKPKNISEKNIVDDFTNQKEKKKIKKGFFLLKINK